MSITAEEANRPVLLLVDRLNRAKELLTACCAWAHAHGLSEEFADERVDVLDFLAERDAL